MRGILHVSVIAAIIGLACGAQALDAQVVAGENGADQADSPRLTGSPVKAENIVSTCDYVFFGQISDGGIPSDPSDDGWTSYTGVGVYVLGNLRGQVEPQIDVSLRILTSGDNPETPPRYGSSYIFFANKATDDADDPYVVVKIIPATADNITLFRALAAK